MVKRSAIVLFAVVLMCAAAAPVAGAKPKPAAPVAPDGFPSWTTVDNFVPPKGAKPPSRRFEGTLCFTTTAMHVVPTPEEAADAVGGDYSHPWALWNEWGYDFTWLAATDPDGAVPLFDLDATLFPGLKAQFFTTKRGDLVPVERGIIRTAVKDRTGSFWELIISPGKAWKETPTRQEVQGRREVEGLEQGRLPVLARAVPGRREPSSAWPSSTTRATRSRTSTSRSATTAPAASSSGTTTST